MTIDQIELKYKVFCNRALNLKSIEAIGFDMDYTLALYNPETFEALAYQETLKKLVVIGYPKEILNFRFDWQYMIRGLAIDKQRGNIIKMDRHRYIKLAYHGLKPLANDDRKSTYDSSVASIYEEPNYAMIDTLFTLADAYLFCQIVDLKDAKPEMLPQSYLNIYNDIRQAIDMCHRDGSIKESVKKNPAKYITRDPHITETMERFKNSGKKLFLLTNSLWDYTNSVMNYVFGNDDTKNLSLDWTSYFDVIITGAAKPAFFTGNPPIYEVDTKTGYLKNSEAKLKLGEVYQGGNVKHLYELLGQIPGPHILYVGDHIYGDILRSKKGLAWRTMLVVSELEQELEIITQTLKDRLHFEELLLAKDKLDNQIETLAFDLDMNRSPSEKVWEQKQAELKNLMQKKQEIRDKMKEQLKHYHQKFHPIWGELMKSGYQNSRFAAQVTNYACLYTSRLSNMRLCSPNKSFRSYRDFMPHDLK